MDSCATCKTCPWWHSVLDADSQCRRNPPHVYRVTHRAWDGSRYTESETEWPHTQQDDWCGEHPERRGSS